MKKIVFILLFLLCISGKTYGQVNAYGPMNTTNLGNISVQDYQAAVLSTFPQTSPLGRIDMQNLGTMSIQSMENMEASVLSSFNQYDLNRDDAISREEFKKMGGIPGAKDFDSLDTNKDGYITRDELLENMQGRVQMPGANRDIPVKTPGQLHEERYPTLRVYDDIDGSYVK
jgi:Ca2+-binding EF-hand superfamily protein